MATPDLPMTSDAQSNSPGVGFDYGDHESHGAQWNLSHDGGPG
jgi:hypothetical protein